MSAAREERPSLQERFERTVAGRIIISAFLAVTLLTLLTANLPASRLREILLHADHPYLYGVALDQSWGVFSPDPRRETIQVTARLNYQDGSMSFWRVPRRNAVTGEYTDYRWLKWSEYVIQPSYSDLWRPTALYVARKFATASSAPVRVTLINSWYPLPPPGNAETRPPISDRTFYSLRITRAMLRGRTTR